MACPKKKIGKDIPTQLAEPGDVLKLFRLLSISQGILPTVTSRHPSCNEKTPLIGSAEYGVETEVNCSDLESSEQHKAKDFQLIHVPKGAVSG